jgi:sulfate permease, SulP family
MISARWYTPWKAWQPLLCKQQMRRDFFAALTGAMLVLPQGMAYAVIAGMPVQYGLYCAMVPTLIAALMGSSWHMVSGPTAVLSSVIGASLVSLAPAGTPKYVAFAIALSMVVGLIQLFIAVLRVARFADHVPASVITGFSGAVALWIVLGQVKHALGIEVVGSNSFVQTIANMTQSISSWQPSVFVVALMTLAISVTVKKWAPTWPAMALAIVGGALLTFSMGLKVPMVGALPVSLPPVSLPDLSLVSSLSEFWQLVKIGLVLALLGLAEAVAIGRGLSVKTLQKINPQQETVGQGLSNFIGSLFSAYPSSGSFTRSGLNLTAGAVTPLAGLMSAVMVICFLLLVAPLGAFLPLAAIAASLWIVAWGLFDWPTIAKALYSRTDALLMLVTFFCAVLVNLEVGMLAGVALALLLHVLRRFLH